MIGISDQTMSAMSYALAGVAARADVRANNMANASTPGFQASTVKFEEALGAALAAGEDPSEALGRPQVVVQDGPADARGNTVNFENEMTGGIKDNLLYETFVHGFNYKLGLMHSAIGARA
jgi:flagellar basal-body rod protein FlgB